MRLNPDCIRQILFEVEANTGYKEPMLFCPEIMEKMNFPEDVILYHVKQCELYGFFTHVTHYTNGDDDVLIDDLTPKGHEFIQKIREDNVWNKTKSIAGSVGSFAISVISNIASNVIEKAILQKIS